MTRPTSPVLWILALGALVPGFASAQVSISLIAISEQDVWVPDVERVENAFRERVPALGGFEVQPRAETMSHIAAARDLGIDCQARDIDCATKIGVIAGADRVLLLRVANRDGNFFLTLLLVDVSKPDDALRVTQWAPTSGAGFDLAIQEASTRLFAPAKHLGSLRVRLTPPTAQVLIDGKPAPSVDGSGVMQGMVPGNHTVEVKLAGYVPYKGNVQVRYAETSELAVALEPLEDGAAPVVADPEPTGDPIAEPTGEGTDAVVADTPATSADPGAELPLLPIIGGGVVGAGVLTLVSGVAMIALADPIVGDVEVPVEDRNTWRVVGFTGIGLAAVGAVATAVGGGLLVYGLLAPSE